MIDITNERRVDGVGRQFHRALGAQNRLYAIDSGFGGTGFDETQEFGDDIDGVNLPTSARGLGEHGRKKSSACANVGHDHSGPNFGGGDDFGSMIVNLASFLLEAFDPVRDI
jgi:hypothetical protein